MENKERERERERECKVAKRVTGAVNLSRSKKSFFLAHFCLASLVTLSNVSLRELFVFSARAQVSLSSVLVEQCVSCIATLHAARCSKELSLLLTDDSGPKIHD